MSVSDVIEKPKKLKAKKATQESTVSKSTKKIVDTAELREWLDNLGLGISPSIKVNGISHPTAVLTVDFGVPINPIRMTNEQTQELNSRMKKITNELYTTEVSVRVSFDHTNGVFWSSIV